MNELLRRKLHFGIYAAWRTVRDTFLLTFFTLRVSYVTGHWSVTERSAGQEGCGWPGGRPDVGWFFGPFGRKDIILFSFLSVYLGLCNVN